MSKVILQFSCGRRSVTDEPGLEIGPTLTFDDYVDFTYDTVRHEGETLAVLNRQGDWEIVSGSHAGETYSDITVSCGSHHAESA